MEYPVFKLKAEKLSEAVNNVTVFNRCDTEYWIYVNIPEYVAKEFNLYEVRELGSEDKQGHEESRDVLPFCVWQKNRPWIDIKFRILNQEPGHHMYRMCFVNKFTDDVIHLYFSYILQVDGPDKPYKYMDTLSGKCACSEKDS